jgi:hypothetical protein
MWTLSPSVPQKIGIVIYGLAVGLCTALGTSAVLLLLGIAISLFAQSTGWIHLGEYQPWLPMIGLEYGFFLGVILGAFVCWRVWLSHLGGHS